MNYSEYTKSFAQAKEITKEEFKNFEKFKIEYTGKIKNMRGRICVVPNVAEAFYHLVKRGAEVYNGGRIEPETVVRVDESSNGNGVNGIESEDNIGGDPIYPDLDIGTEGHASGKKGRNQGRHLDP